MRILLVTQFYWPESRTAPANLAAVAEKLQAKGHELLVVTGFPNHPHGRIYEGYQQKIWEWDEVGGVRVLRLPLYPDHSASLLGRGLNAGSFMMAASTLGLWKSRKFKPDVIFAYYAPQTMGVVAAVLRLFHRAPVAYWVTDLWMENLRAAEMSVPAPTYNLMAGLENWGHAQASALFVASPGHKSKLVEKGIPEERIFVIPEWADERLYYPVDPDPGLARRYELAKHFNVIYGGNLGVAQGLETVLEAAKMVSDIEDLQFVFIGDGTDQQRLMDLVARDNVDNVRFIPRQPMSEIHQFFALGDVLLVHLKDLPIFKLQMPSKVLAYLACGRPILCAFEGIAAQTVIDAGAGVSCPAESPDLLARRVRELYSMPRLEREQLGANGRRAYLENFTLEVSVEKIEKALEEVAVIHS